MKHPTAARLADAGPAWSRHYREAALADCNRRAAFPARVLDT